MERITQKIFPKMKPSGVDGVQSVRMLLLCFVAYLLVSGGYKANPILFKAFLDKFKVSREEASYPVTVYNFVTNFSGLFLAPLAAKFTVRPVAIVCTILGALGYIINYFVSDLTVLAITFGGGAGLCFGMMVITVSVLMTQYFHQYRTTAIAAVFAAGATGGFIYPSVLSFFYTTYGYNTLMLASGLLLLLCVPLCCFLKEPDWIEKNDEDRPTETETKPGILEQLSTLKELLFYVILLPSLIYYWATASCITTMVDFAQQKGYTNDEGKHLTEILAALEMIGQLFLPILCNRGYISNEWMAFIVYCLSGVMLVVWPFCPTYTSMLILLVIAGPAFGLSSILYRVFVGTYVGMNRMKMAFGLLVAVKGLLTLALPSFLGFFVDKHHNYDGMYMTCGIMLIAVSLMWIPMAVKRMREQRSLAEDQEALREAE